MKVLLVDAFDSFVFIVEQYLKTLGLQTTVVRCNHPDLRMIAARREYDFFVLGPGPGHPRDAGYVELLNILKQSFTPVLGVCLGHQAIGLAFGGEVVCAERIMHGKTSEITNDGRGVFAHTRGMPVIATRYHSLIIKEDTLPSTLEITARSKDDGYIMGVRHRTLPIEGVQFHPESVMTVDGIQYFQSFIDTYLVVAQRAMPVAAPTLAYPERHAV